MIGNEADFRHLPRPPADEPRTRLETFKLPFGHRGGNHPVKDLTTGRVEITSQNHGFAVVGPGGVRYLETNEPVRWETDLGTAELSHLNLYDRTVEGLTLLDVPGGTVQYHPEAGPGPNDASTSSTVSWSRSMPRRDDLKRIMILGSGPIVIGQAAEFDYSGAQACKILREEGLRGRPRELQPGDDHDRPGVRRRDLRRAAHPVGRRPDHREGAARRPPADLGGQTALNLAKALQEDGTLDKFSVELIGANYDAIHRAEDREAFANCMAEAGLKMPASGIAEAPLKADGQRDLDAGFAQALEVLKTTGLPAIIRPAFTLGGRGGGMPTPMRSTGTSSGRASMPRRSARS